MTTTLEPSLNQNEMKEKHNRFTWATGINEDKTPSPTLSSYLANLSPS